MNLSAPFIRLPVMTTLVMVGILLFGAMGYTKLPKADLPTVDFPTVSVTANLPGANPETMAAAVATPLERQFSTISGIDSMVSTSGLGVTSITIQFVLSRNIDGAALDVQSAITAALKQLPPGMPTPPSFQKVNPADQAILYLGLTSDTQPMSTIDEYGETMMAERISMVSGVAQVQVFGTQKYAVRVQLDPAEMAAHSVTYDDVQLALQNSNVNLPTGVLYGHHQAYTIEANGQLTDAAKYDDMVVAYRNGAPIRLSQLGHAVDSVQNAYTAFWYRPESVDGKAQPEKRAVVLAIQRQPGSNIVQIVDDIKALLPKFRAKLPASISLDVIYDRSQTIRSSIEDVKTTLILTVILVILVIFAFLRSLSATIIPSLSLPMSLIGTFACMYLLDYNLDNLSLMALTLSAGFVVDDAIVVLENIVRHIEEGDTVDQAAKKGSAQIGFTVLSMTISLTAVFIPLLFMGGMLGRLFREFAVTITVSILISGFVSLTLTPMLCHRFLRPPSHKRPNALSRAAEAVFQGAFSAYRETLKLTMMLKPAVIVLAVLMLGLSAWLFTKVPTDFIPNEDADQLIGFTQAAQDISFEDMIKHQKLVSAAVSKSPNIASYICGAPGGTASQVGNQGFIVCRLVPRAKRPGVTPEAIMAMIRKETRDIPGILVRFQNPPPIRIGGRLTAGQYQYTLQGTDVDELDQEEPLLEEEIRKLPGVVDVNTDLLIQSPRMLVSIDRDKAAKLGISIADVENTLAEAFGSQQVSTIYTDVNEYWVVLETLPSKQLNPEDLDRIYLRSSSVSANSVMALQGGASPVLIPLSTIVKLTRKVAALTLSHQGQLPAVTISFNLKEGVALGDVVTAIQHLPLPTTISGSFQGTAQVYKDSLTGLTVLLFIAIAVIYMVLGILYESFIHPITILSGLPSAGIGAMVTLLMTYWLQPFGVAPVPLNLYAFVGVIMLIGIVKKNAIMMIDFGIQYQRQGAPAEEAIVKGCLVRFRPIMMTTMCALMGCIPIAFNIIGTSNSRHSLGLAVVGGLLFSQLITLYITPVVFVYLDRLQVLLKRLARDRREVAPSRDGHGGAGGGHLNHAAPAGGGAMVGVRAPEQG